MKECNKIRPQNLTEIINLIKNYLLKNDFLQKIISIYFFIFPSLSTIIYRHPSRRIRVIGITGTDGKSTTVSFVANILKEMGYKVGYSSSVYTCDGESIIEKVDKTTMPGRFFIQRFLRKLVDNKCDFAVIEVTSEGVKYMRHLFIKFDTVVCTNLSPEHVVAHGGFEKYKRAKMKIFRNVSNMVVNGDDRELDDFLKYDADRKVRFGFDDESVDVFGKVVKSDLFGNVMEVNGERIEIKCGGPFVLPNALCAIAVGSVLGVPMEVCKTALEKSSPPPGRFEVVSTYPLVIVDYGHTIKAVETLLSFVRGVWGGRIVHIFGGNGNRDTEKRKMLANLSEQLTDFSIITENNPRDDSPKEILEELQSYFNDKKRVLSIEKREDAVKEALSMPHKNTLFLFQGKGSEKLITGPFRRQRYYNEKETILSCLNN